MARIPATLPPPYTTTGTRAASLRTNASDFSTTAEILVGPDRTRYLIHTSLLTKQSPYFRAALTSSFLEASTQSISLPDIHPETFTLLVEWLYNATLKPLPFKEDKPAYYTLLHLYILADRLCFEGLRNHIVDAISDLAESTNSVLTPSDTRLLYEGVREDAKIRELVLDLFAFKKTDKLIDTHPDRWHAGFLRDLIVRLKRPCKQAMQRHTQRMWLPKSWESTRACDNCRVILPPLQGAIACDECCCAWCIPCAGEGVAVASWEDGRPSMSYGAEAGKKAYGAPRKWESCRPWKGSRCMVYHEHRETEACWEVFMGR
ncbi:hypothetical protein BU26DRAFT_562308 [Trematosphaeria pertusa]|uniref:BTB domain-containing protein n=1 Tax=Trematosphaeria pertusa TaxID=390896 RepID=A0A6A6ISR0_9PLEO|nr:uncharacterized protein BU26DRAFT_562308 [Trematosphaeria pertusa]KAF2252573.1 hypothetical protein BU26DRAFT_562308 [Trematosphaeria pertusa]